MCCVCNADLTVRGAMVLTELTPLLVAAVCSATQEKRVWFIPYFSLSGLPSDGAFVIAFSCSAYTFSDLSGSFYDCLFPPASLEKGELFHISFTEGLRFHAPCSLLSPRTNSCLALSMFSQTAIQCLYPVSKGYTIPARSSKLFFFFFDKGAGKNRFNGFISGSQVLTNGALPNSSSSGASLSSEPLSEAEC